MDHAAPAPGNAEAELDALVRRLTERAGQARQVNDSLQAVAGALRGQRRLVPGELLAVAQQCHDYTVAAETDADRAAIARAAYRQALADIMDGSPAPVPVPLRLVTGAPGEPQAASA